MKPADAPAERLNLLLSIKVREIRLQVCLADGAQLVVRYPENWRIRPENGQIEFRTAAGGPARLINPGDVVGLRPVDVVAAVPGGALRNAKGTG